MNKMAEKQEKPYKMEGKNLHEMEKMGKKCCGSKSKKKKK
jgi:hypothetical protein